MGRVRREHRAERGRKCRADEAGMRCSPSLAAIIDASKKVLGRKRQALVDTDGRALVLEPQPADVQDRDGAAPVLRLSRRTFPSSARRSPTQVRWRPASRGHDHHRRNRAQTAQPGRLRCPSAQVGGRAALRPAQPQPSPLEGSRGHARSAKAFLYVAAVLILIGASLAQSNFSDRL